MVPLTQIFFCRTNDWILIGTEIVAILFTALHKGRLFTLSVILQFTVFVTFNVEERENFINKLDCGAMVTGGGAEIIETPENCRSD
jgi:hypothetical protein